MSTVTRMVATFTARPDVNVAIFAFLLNYPWEFLQVPFYQIMPSSAHWSAILVCSLATLGDVIIMLVAFWLTALVARSAYWVIKPRATDVTLFVVIGLVITLVIEHNAVRAVGGWRYATSMPLLPLLGTGLAPVLQWLLLPPLALWFVRRQVRGAELVGAAKFSNMALEKTTPW